MGSRTIIITVFILQARSVMRLLAGPLVTGAGQGDLCMYEQHNFIKGKSGFKQFMNLAAIFALSKGIIFFLEKCKKTSQFHYQDAGKVFTSRASPFKLKILIDLFSTVMMSANKRLFFSRQVHQLEDPPSPFNLTAPILQFSDLTTLTHSRTFWRRRQWQGWLSGVAAGRL